MITTGPKALPYRTLAILLLLAVLSGCASSPQRSNDNANINSAEKIYSDGRAALQIQDYTKAGKYFKSLEVYYPNSPYTHQAQMELAYAYFKSGEYSSAIATTDQIIRNFPDNDNLDYARYLKALSSFEQAAALIEQGQDTDNTILAAQTSLQYFNDLANQFPNSKYQQDAEKRVAYLKEQLAQYEVAAARRDIEQGNHASAVIHARNVIENYPQTHSAADALAISDIGYEFMAIGNSSPTADAPTDNSDADTAMQEPVANIDMESAVTGTAVTMAESANAATEPMTDAMMSQAPATNVSGSDMDAEINTATDVTAASETAVEMDMTGQPAGTHPATWILEQPADQYTIQLISTVKDDTLERFIETNQLRDKTAYFRKLVNGRTRHTLIYGIYPDITAAKAAIAELPESVGRSKPWVLGISTVQKAIKEFNDTP